MSNIQKVYKSKAGIKYAKDDEGNLFIEIKKEEGKTENLCITGFEEGDYGLWIEEKAPYFIESGNIVCSATGTKAPKSSVLALEENKFLQAEERIKDDFLWIYPGETIVFPNEEKSETRNNKNQEESVLSGVIGASGEGNTTTAKNNDSSDNQQNSNKSDKSQDSANDSGQFYVCAGAELKCSFGDQTSKLEVVSGHNSKVCGNLIANVMDYQPLTNIMPFGKCQTTNNPQVASATRANDGHLTPQPCVPNIPTPWTKVKADVKVGKQTALLEGSKLTCAYSGQIEIVDPGQSILKE